MLLSCCCSAAPTEPLQFPAAISAEQLIKTRISALLTKQRVSEITAMISVHRLNHRAAKRKHLHGTLPTAAVSREPLKQTMPLSQSNRWWDMSRGGRLCVEMIAGPLQHSTELSSGCGGQMCVKGSARRRRAPGYEQRGSRGKSDRKSGKMEKKK